MGLKCLKNGNNHVYFHGMSEFINKRNIHENPCETKGVKTDVKTDVKQ